MVSPAKRKLQLLGLVMGLALVGLGCSYTLHTILVNGMTHVLTLVERSGEHVLAPGDSVDLRMVEIFSVRTEERTSHYRLKQYPAHDGFQGTRFFGYHYCYLRIESDGTIEALSIDPKGRVDRGRAPQPDGYPVHPEP